MSSNVNAARILEFTTFYHIKSAKFPISINFTNPLKKNYLSPNIPKNHQKINKTFQNVGRYVRLAKRFHPYHPNMMKASAFSHIIVDASSTQSVNILETFNAYQYIHYKFDFCSYSFHIFRFSRSGKVKVDVFRFLFLSKHSSDHNELCCHDPLSHLAIDASCPSCMKLMHTRTDSPQLDTTLRKK